jgi:hypothetical protein
MSDDVHLIGFDNLDSKLRNPKWISRPLGDFFDTWRLAVQHQAVANIKRGPGGWINTGDTRRQLTSERDTATFPVWARVGWMQGSALLKARWGEYGTGTLSEDPLSSHKRHWPPTSALEKWATKRGLNAFLVARAIGRRGGIAPRRFLRDAVATTEPKIGGWLATMAKAIEAEAGNA